MALPTTKKQMMTLASFVTTKLFSSDLLRDLINDQLIIIDDTYAIDGLANAIACIHSGLSHPPIHVIQGQDQLRLTIVTGQTALLAASHVNNTNVTVTVLSATATEEAQAQFIELAKTATNG